MMGKTLDRASIAMIAILLLLGGADLAGATSDGDKLVACYSKDSGSVQMRGMSGLPSRCPRGYVRFTWSVVGPQGPAGPTGPVGPAGPEGAPGPMGPQGLQGPSGPQGVTGPMGPAGPQGATGATGPMGPPGGAGTLGPAGPMGPTGPMGPQGATGPMGPTGPAGSSGISGLELVTASSAVNSTNTKIVTATCPAGKTVIAGGGSILAGTATPVQLQDVAIGSTLPTPALDGWTVTAWETDSVTPTWSLTVYARCAVVA